MKWMFEEIINARSSQRELAKVTKVFIWWNIVLLGLIRNYSHPTGPNHLTKVELKTNNQQMLSNGFEAKFWNNEKLAVFFNFIWESSFNWYNDLRCQTI